MSSDLPTPQNPDIHGKRPKSDREATLRNPLAEHRVRSTIGPSKYFHTRPNTLLNAPLAWGVWAILSLPGAMPSSLVTIEPYLPVSINTQHCVSFLELDRLSRLISQENDLDQLITSRRHYLSNE